MPSKQKAKFDTPMSWTRVRCVENSMHHRMTIFDVDEDLNADRSLKQIRKGSAREIGTMLFDPYSYDAEKEQLTIDNYKFEEEQLLEYAKLASQIRRKLS